MSAIYDGDVISTAQSITCHLDLDVLRALGESGEWMADYEIAGTIQPGFSGFFLRHVDRSVRELSRSPIVEYSMDRDGRPRYRINRLALASFAAAISALGQGRVGSSETVTHKEV